MRVVFLFVVGSLLAGSAVGCVAESGGSDLEGSEEEALSTADLRALSNIQKEISGEGTVDLSYVPQPAPYRNAPIKFEGVAVNLADAEGEEVEVQVTGRFPGYGRVLVVDESFHIVASAKTSTSSGLRVQTDGPALGVARMRVVIPNGGRILVRDRRWDRPMDFQVGIRR